MESPFRWTHSFGLCWPFGLPTTWRHCCPIPAFVRSTERVSAGESADERGQNLIPKAQGVDRIGLGGMKRRPHDGYGAGHPVGQRYRRRDLASKQGTRCFPVRSGIHCFAD